jgi:hypothetical protein
MQVLWQLFVMSVPPNKNTSNDHSAGMQLGSFVSLFRVDPGAGGKFHSNSVIIMRGGAASDDVRVMDKALGQGARL